MNNKQVPVKELIDTQNETIATLRAQLAAAAQREAELRAMLEEMYNYWYEPTKSDINLDGITLKQKAARLLLAPPVDAENKV